jgi:hypothetical protein
VQTGDLLTSPSLEHQTNTHKGQETNMEKETAKHSLCDGNPVCVGYRVGQLRATPTEKTHQRKKDVLACS